MGDDHRARTQAAYDRVAEDYGRIVAEAFPAKPLEEGLLAAFASEVAAAGGGPVLEVGCGPGRMTGLLHDLGLDVTGLDLSSAMVDVARRTHPHLRFEVGDLTGLDRPDGSLAGVVAWYSIIHLPPADRPAAFAELHRVLRPGGFLQLAFQAGDEVVHLTEAYGHAVDLDAHRLDPDRIVALLADAGFEERHRTISPPAGVEPTPQAYVLARKPTSP